MLNISLISNGVLPESESSVMSFLEDNDYFTQIHHVIFSQYQH